MLHPVRFASAIIESAWYARSGHAIGVAARMPCQTFSSDRRMNEAAFLEREFELNGSGLSVRFYMPSKAPGGEFQCQYSVGWPEREVRRYACGLDGVQALMLAMRTVHTELVESDAYKAGRLTWCGQADLDLPPVWGGGSLDDLPPQPDGDAPTGPA